MADEHQNGNVLKHRVTELERARAQDLELVKFLSEKGQENNQQIKVHDSQIAALHEDVLAIQEKALRVPVLEERQDTMLKALNRARTAGWAAAASLIVLTVTIIVQGGGAP